MISKLILGSQSIGRAQVLKNAGYDFTVMHADIDEKAIRSDDYEKMVLLIAQEKARVLLSRISEPALLITADHVMVCNGQLREKPQSIQEARRFLESYSNNSAISVSAVVVTDTQTNLQKSGVEVSTVYFKQIPEAVITAVLKEKNVMSMSGALNIEDPLIVPYINHIEGNRDSVIGLPMKLLQSMLI